jgi:putative addiction module component (TIGR02574 family)
MKQTLFDLPAADRLRLAIDLLESVADTREDGFVSDHDKAILDKCIAEDHASSNDGITWNELEKRLQRKARRKK